MENLTTAQIEMELKRRKNEVKKLPKKSGKEVRKFDEFVNYIDDEGSEYSFYESDVKTLLEKDWKKLEDFAKKNNICPAMLNMGNTYMDFFEETLDEIRDVVMNKSIFDEDYNKDIFDEETRIKNFEIKMEKKRDKDFTMLYDKVKINFVKKNKYIMW